MHDDTAQNDFTCRLEWGWRGAERAARRGDLIVVVDVLSFSTTCATACYRQSAIIPCCSDDEAQAVSAVTGAERGVHRRDVPEKGRFSLSPISFLDAEPGMTVALPSPNGATCCKIAQGDAETRALVFVGAFVNAQATTLAVYTALESHRAQSVTVLACGERWADGASSGDGPLRFALEDFLGAGAVLSFLPAHLSRSPEARAAQAAFIEAAPDLETTLLTCGSGIELVRKGYKEDVIHAARLNIYDTPALLQNKHIDAVPLLGL